MSTGTPTSAAAAPRLRWYSQAWRLVLCVLISAAVWGNTWSGQWHHDRVRFWIDLAGGAIAFVVVLRRRRWPLPVALGLVALGSVSGAAAGPGILAAVSMATRRQWSQIVLVGLTAVIAWTVYNETQPTSAVITFGSPDAQRPATGSPIDLVVILVIIAAALSWGMYVGSRRELLWTLRERAETAEAEQELRVAGARITERARIAREMHDVVAHRISHVSMQAGAMAFREDLTADELSAGAALIQTQANRALEELRSVLGVLRDPATGATLHRPQPTFADVDELISDARSAGMKIDAFIEMGTDAAAHAGSDAVPDATGRTVYRIVQEGLTNARKHSPGALVSISVTGSPTNGIDIVIRNPIGFSSAPAAPGAGLGLAGLAERAALMGGRLQHARRDATFELRGWIPWAA